MNKISNLLVASVVFAIVGFFITKDAYKPNSGSFLKNHRGRILGPTAIIGSLIAFYKFLEAYFEC